MGHAKEAPTRASPLGTLFVAWMVTVGLAFAPIATYYYQTGDLRMLIAFSAAAFVIGAALFIAMGLAALGGRSSKRATQHEGPIADVHKRGALFGKR